MWLCIQETAELPTVNYTRGWYSKVLCTTMLMIYILGQSAQRALTLKGHLTLNYYHKTHIHTQYFQRVCT